MEPIEFRNMPPGVIVNVGEELSVGLLILPYVPIAPMPNSIDPIGIIEDEDCNGVATALVLPEVASLAPASGPLEYFRIT